MSSTITESRGQYLQEAKVLRLEARPLAPLADDEVRIAIRATTVCGSDVHYYTHFANGSIRVRESLCLGHEAAGQVTALGAGVAAQRPDLQVGDSVALECGVPCGDHDGCPHCRAGRYNVCPRLRFRSSGSAFPHFQGTLQEHVDHPARWVHRLPSALNFETGALLEPLAVAIHAVRRGGIPDIVPGGRSTCLVFGAGAVGLLCAVAAQAQGCRDVAMVDIDEGRLQFARDHGFATAILAVKPRRGEDLQAKLDIARETAAEIAALTWPDGTPVGRVQRTYECTGAESCLQSSIYATGSGGSVLIVGMGIPNHTLPISDMSAREINLVATWRYANAYPRAIEIATASVSKTPIDGNTLPDISSMITHRFEGLDRVQDALETARKTRDDDGKLVVKTVVDF